MKTLLVAATALLAAVTLTADSLPEDETTARLTVDLETLARVVQLADDPRDHRDLLLRMIDEDIDMLRDRRDDGSYRWASLERQEGSRVSEEKALERVYSEPDPHTVSVSGSNAYRILVEVPEKRGIFARNSKVYVNGVVGRLTRFDGTIDTVQIPVERWIEPGDAHGIPLPEIAKSATVTVQLGVARGGEKAIADVSLLQARLVDDPRSPHFPAVRRLGEIRAIVDRNIDDRGALKSRIDEAILSMPGELEERARQQAEARERRLRESSGETAGAITPGDATPDVVHRLRGIANLLAGNAEQQADGRRQLDALIGFLARPAAGAAADEPPATER